MVSEKETRKKREQKITNLGDIESQGYTMPRGRSN